MRSPILLTIAPLLLAAASAALAESESVTVTMTYRERIALPPDARVDVQLLDTSRADAAAVVISAQRFAIGGVPKTVRLAVDPAVIDERHTYTVSARISSGNDVLFRTTSAFPVLTRGAGDEVDLLLERMPPAADARTEPHPPRATGVAWAVFEIAGRALVVDDPPTLTIDDEGKFSLYAGCNRFEGRVQIDGNGLDFSETGSLRKPCPGPREKLERDVLDVLPTVSGFTRNGQLLALTNAAGVAVLRLRERPE